MSGLCQHYQRWIHCWPEGFIPQLINLQLFAHKLIKWLPGECADWVFDNIMTWSYCLHRWYSMSWQIKTAFWMMSMHWTMKPSPPGTFLPQSGKPKFPIRNQNSLKVLLGIDLKIINLQKLERPFPSMPFTLGQLLGRGI